MIILGIETSCDETGASVVHNGTHVLSNVIASSVQDMVEYGGVFPEVAARRQLEFINSVIDQALKEAFRRVIPSSTRPEVEVRTEGRHADHLDAIAVTKCPGLLTSLLVGTTAARVLSSVWKKPIIGVHHTFGHLSSPWLECNEDIAFPIITLSVSGGHSDIWLRKSHTRQELIGSTKDDAAGEAFDKGAAMLQLPYPGGPSLSKLAESGNPHFIEFPHPLRGEKTCDFSFSGLKTSLKYTLRDRGGINALSVAEKKDIAASFQEAICDHLVSQIERALSLYSHIKEVHIVGGVSSNKKLRSLFQKRLSIPIHLPTKMEYCTDNAAMIASAGFFLQKEQSSVCGRKWNTEASATL